MPAQALHTVDGALQDEISRQHKFLQGLEQDTLLLLESAEEMEGDGQTDKVAELRAANVESLELGHKLKCHLEALQKLNSAYKYDAANPVDFQKYLEGETRCLAAQKPFTPESHPMAKRFEEAVWKVRHPNEAMPGEDDDEIMMDKSGFPNNKCPITHKDVTKLDDPVRGTTCRHIYSSEAMNHYLGNNHAGRRCPISGCSSILTRATVECDALLKLEIRQEAARERAAEHNKATDYTELE